MEGERRRLPYFRLALVSGLLTTISGTGYWGWRTFSQPKAPAAAMADANGVPAAPPVDGAVPATVEGLAGDPLPADPMGGNSASPSQWNNVSRTAYQDPNPVDPSANPAAPPDLGNPAAGNDANPYRGGGSFAQLADPVDAPQNNPAVPPEPPALEAPADYAPANELPPGVAQMAQEMPTVPSDVPDANADPGYGVQPQDAGPALAPAPLEINNTPPPRPARPGRSARAVADFNDPAPAAAPQPEMNQGYGSQQYGSPNEITSSQDSPAYDNGAGLSRSITGGIPKHQASAVPGDRRLEGTQAPALALEKSAPAEIQINKPATFVLHVRNVGQAVARNVVVTDEVPRGTSLSQARPQAEQNGGSLTWQLGDLAPGGEATIEMVLIPEAEGEIGSVAQVSCQALASARTVCTRPNLVIDHIGPQQVLIGEQLSLAITLTNTGTGPATNVVIEEDVPNGLAHVAGRELEYEVGTLKPGETRRMELTLQAAQQGVTENVILARGDGNLRAEHRSRIEVIAPLLEVDVAGPKRRYLDRQATYEVSLANPGTAVARNVDLTAFLPRGMKFVGADSEGQYDATRHAVQWSLEELPADKRGTVKVTTVPREPGEHVLRVETRGDRNLTASGEQLVIVEAAPELVFSVVDLSDPIEVGSETGYEVRIVNNGTKAASNVQLAVVFPAELQAIGGDGPTRSSGDTTRVVFDPVPRLQPREEVAFKVTGKALRAGDIRIRVQLSSDEEPTPVTKEESTRIYADQ